MNNVHANTGNVIKCDKCNREFKYQSSLKRHIVRNICNNRSIPTDLPQVHADLPQVHADLPQVHADLSQVHAKFKCNLCNREYKYKYNLVRHNKKPCIDILKCPKCHKLFTSKQGKRNHIKNVQCTAVIPYDETSKDHPTVIQNQTNNYIQNQTNQINNSTNTINVNIVVFNPEDVTKITPFLTNHINMKLITDAIKNNDNPDIFIKYTEELFKKPENRCIKKTNLRSSHSSVHVGNNKWKIKPDALVYPKVVSDTAALAQELVQTCKEKTKKNKAALDNLMAFNEYISDNGYCNETKEKQERVKSQYKRVISGTKSVVYENTKKETQK